MLDFEKPIFELEKKIEELRRLQSGDFNIIDELKKLEDKKIQLIKKVYKNLTPWQKVSVARHTLRPHSSNYIKNLIEDFMPLSGDRCFGEDLAIIAGIGRFNGTSVVVIGHEKGRETEDRIKHNFGMPHPEGYRKCVRLIEMANRFKMPIITFIDTAGAYPGVGAEERGQAEAIAKCLSACLNSDQPIISVIIGEGGSGGAIALAAANVVLMLENSVYSVISPEGCASILWRSAEKCIDAANALKLTAADMMEMKIIDEIIPEPLGGAHTSYEEAFDNMRNVLSKYIDNLIKIDDHKKNRIERFMKYGGSI
ncbi:acetyl-coenzyme A carboxylase carboxyl transferase subunit alpha-like [Ranitomeya imitator]|uniref:acetyl-coenzyme A carboxylase carboxyl transferase subunit alpha-like n=1 Tax=Ranitomeya imitator TaxID=111125 RepID=UPI0037E822D4